jgi:restriction endonuclease S subunit
LTKAGDIVVKLSAPYDAAYITEEDEGLLITSFCIIIRNTGKEIQSEYLAAFTNSDVYLTQVMSLVSGAQVPMLTIGKVKEVNIKLLPTSEQEQVAEYYKNLCEKEKVMKQIIELEKEKLSAVLGGK